MSCSATIISLWLFGIQLSCNQWTIVAADNVTGSAEYEEIVKRNRLITEVYSKLDLNETREFISSFSLPFERESIHQQLQSCPFTSLCGYNLSLTSKQSDYSGLACCGLCTCEFPNCLNDQSCCLDIISRNANVSAAQLPKDKETTTKKCMRMSLSGSTNLEMIMGNSNRDVIVHAECPLNTTSELRRNCSTKYTRNLREFKDLTPVYDVRTLDLYRNAYCAHCHNVTDTHLEKVSVQLECHEACQFKSEQDIIRLVMEKQQCNLTFTLPQIILPEFCDWEVSECNITGKWLDYDPDIERACSLYRTTIHIDKTRYRNIFCAFCNGISNNNVTWCRNHMDFGGTSFPFTGLLKLGTYFEQKGTASENDNCTLQQLYDSVYDTCRDLVCPPHKMLQGGQCADIFASLGSMFYTVFLKVVPYQTITVLQGDRLADHLIDTIRELNWEDGYVCGIQMVYTVDAEMGVLNVTHVIHSVVQYFVVRIVFDINKYHDADQFVETVLSIDQLQIGVIYYEETSKHMQNFQGQIQLFNQDPEMFDRISNLSWESSHEREVFVERTLDAVITHLLDTADDSDIQLTLESAITNYSQTGDNSGFQFPHLTGPIELAWCATNILNVNILQMKPCVTVKLSKNDTQWIHHSNGITLMPGEYTLQNSEFYLEDKETIVVCTHVYKKYMTLQTEAIKELGMSIETVLSVVCSSMSILCLSFTFLAFCMLSKLRKHLPGINNMILVAVLLCAQSMYLIAGIGVLDFATIGCVAFGIVLHFIWLLSMFWMNVCTYHMFHVLTNMTTVSRDSWGCRFGVYLLYAIIMASVPVAVNIVMSTAKSNSLGYGEYVCYISSQKMVIYTFVVPTAFVVVTNLCMFVYVMIKIKRTSMVKNTVNHERNNLLIFVKLSTITGITWVFGFIYSWTDIVVFSYLFISLNAGQGVFIMLAFILNSRVLNMFKSDILRRSLVSSSGNVNNVNTSNGINKSVEHTKL